MSWLSVSSILWGAFIAYAAYTVYSIGQLLSIPSCERGDRCLQPYLSSENARLQLYVYTSIFNNPSSDSSMNLVHHNAQFDPTNEESPQYPAVVNITLPRMVHLKNGTMYLHVFMAAGDVKIKSWMDLVSSSVSAVHAGSELVVHHTPPPTPYSLVGETEVNSTRYSAAERPVPHLYTSLTFSVMTELRPLPHQRLPQEILHRVRLAGRHYLPLLVLERMQQRTHQLEPVGKRTMGNLTLHFTPTGLPRLRLWLQFEGALQTLSQLGFSSKDIDEVKSIFDTNLYLLTLTFAVSLLHLLLDVLAFKSDIAFWRRRDTLAGLSGGAVLWRAVAQAIIFLYLLEEDTSLLVLGPAGVAVVIELWKVSVACRVWYLRPSSAVSASDEETRALDSQAFRYLGVLLMPLCVAGAVWSLLHVPHKSWYSWFVSSAVNGVYALGFLFMLPQLFINYRLKSVAHLPWRAFMYKAFNTVIDDLFAFIITMPVSHRVACFRDDIVFIIYLYQRWLYPVDAARVNEFGTSALQEQQEKRGSGDAIEGKKSKTE